MKALNSSAPLSPIHTVFNASLSPCLFFRHVHHVGLPPLDKETSYHLGALKVLNPVAFASWEIGTCKDLKLSTLVVSVILDVG